MKDWTPATVNVCHGTSFHTNIANMHGSERIVRQKQKNTQFLLYGKYVLPSLLSILKYTLKILHMCLLDVYE